MQQTKRVKNPSKQRKMLFNAPAHIRHKLMAAPLSSELAASKGAKTLPVRRGDTVLIKRGDNKGFEGKVSRVDLKEYRIYLEGLTREKVDGTNIFLPIHPSKVQIRNLSLDDKWRKEILGRKKPLEKPAKQEKAKTKLVKKVDKIEAKIQEVKEEKPSESPKIEEKVAPEITKEPAPAMSTETVIKPKKSATKKPTAAKAAIAEKNEPLASVKNEKTSAKKVVKPKAVAKKKVPVAKKAEAKETTTKSRVKSTSSKKTQGEQ